MGGQMSRIVICMFLVCTAAVSCQFPFSIREPEQPDTSQSQWTIPVSPEIVLSNLQRSVHEKSAEYFIRCLADTAYTEKKYIFIPDPESAAQFAGIFNRWNRQKEEGVVRQMFSLVPDDSVCTLILSMVQQTVASDSAVMVVDYSLSVGHTGTALENRVFKGRAEFWMASDMRGEWSVYRWLDWRTSDISPWTVLKAKLGG